MKFYRYEDVMYAGPVDECGDYSGPGELRVELREYEVVKTTPKGAWIRRSSMDNKRFVNLQARKQYACPTIEEAAESFKARKNAQIRIHQARVVRAQRALYILAHGKEVFLS